ncbi:uncharacterized protein LOC119308799 [Triticum dicoccoides]|uniref:uncharacterized protein LOC119308799 n=1 Tax=Triticum dicoccoides TaxID=85692 RepID=UPI001890E4F8|nr:uncharacterized protein LOC119308799 [Triticum dicoccoides]
MTLLDVAAYQQKIKLSHRLEDWGYIDCFLKPMQITLLKKERKLEISFQFYRCKINSFHCNTGHPDVQDVGSIGVAFMNLTYTFYASYLRVIRLSKTTPRRIEITVSRGWIRMEYLLPW